MAHNAYIRALGVWPASSVLTSVEMAAFDLRQFQAVNGDLGGVWAPAAAITIGGSGIAATGPLVASDADITIGHGRFLTVLGTAGGALGTVNVNLGAHVNLLNGSVTTLAGLLNMTAAGDIVADSGSTITLDGAVSLGATGTLSTAALSTMTLQGTVNVSGGAAFTFGDNSIVGLNGDTTFGATAVVVGNAAATMVLNGAVTLNGATSIDGTPTVLSGTTLAFAAGSALSAAATAPFALANIVTCSNQVEFASGCVATVQTGASWVTQAGATITRGAEETRTGRVILSGSGATTEPRRGTSSAADATFDPSTKDIWQVPAGLGGNIIYTLSSPSHPCTFTFTRIATSGANSVTINRAYDGAQLFVLTAAAQRWCDIAWDGAVMETIRGATI